MTTSSHAPVRQVMHWFEIPVHDLGRAQAFYEALLDLQLRREVMGPHAMAVFEQGAESVGCLMQGEGAVPAAGGVVVYLGADPSLDEVLARVERLGGRVVTPKTLLPGDMGAFAHVADSEGNRIGLHAAQ